MSNDVNTERGREEKRWMAGRAKMKSEKKVHDAAGDGSAEKEGEDKGNARR